MKNLKAPQTLGSFIYIRTIVAKIKDWKTDERPREKLASRSAKDLDNSELLSILLRTGSRNETAVDLAKKILATYNNSLGRLYGASFENLCSIDGIGAAKAATILAALELAVRIQNEPEAIIQQITSSKDAAGIIQPHLQNLDHEECWVIYLNRSNRLISKERISIGGVSSTIIDIKLVIKKAIEKLASSIIIAHNHPSGNPQPGEQDKIQTKRLKDAATLVDISLLDHIIIAGNKYYSFSDESFI